MAESTDKAVMDAEQWGRKLIEDLAREALKERRAKRRWRIFFMLVFLGLILFSVVQGLSDSAEKQVAAPHVAVVDLDGVIADSEEAVSADHVIQGLRRAFDADSKAVVLRINSPGGSPVQAGMIADEMKRLRKEYPDKPLYAVIEEMGASAAYYIAAVADQIYVDKASIVGSIGVIMNGFGAQELVDKVGLEPRIYTAGKNKAFMNPFAPVPPEQKAHVQAMLDEVHKQFITVVKEGRGKRLKENADIFSGLFWTGERSLALGLADGLGSVSSVARDLVGVEEVVDYTQRSQWEIWTRQFGASVASGFWSKLEMEAAGNNLRLR
ncbi:MAG: S49 family peptidase [Lautropia sp.]|nr:S49 family peptidase [Lautropia sp.]